MDEAAKRRLVGAAVLVALAVIFVPMLVEQDRDEQFGDPIVIPDPPAFEPYGTGAEGSEDGFNEGPGSAEPDSLPLPVPQPPSPSADADRPQPAASEPAASGAGPKPIPKGVSAWVVQVASLRSENAALGLQNELRAMGYPAFIEQAEVDGRRYFRVRVGPEVERARADQTAERLAQETAHQPLVQRYP